MNILGINSYLHDASVALFVNGRMVSAAEEERFSRIKRDQRFPRLSLQAALDHAGLGFHDVDAIAFGWNRAPATSLHTLRSVVRGAIPRDAWMVADCIRT